MSALKRTSDSAGIWALNFVQDHNLDHHSQTEQSEVQDVVIHATEYNILEELLLPKLRLKACRH